MFSKSEKNLQEYLFCNLLARELIACMCTLNLQARNLIFSSNLIILYQLICKTIKRTPQQVKFSILSFFLSKKCIFLKLFTVWAPKKYLQGVGSDFSVQPSDCWVNACALLSHSAQLSLSAILGLFASTQPLRPIRVQRGMGKLGCEILNEYGCLENSKGFGCLVAVLCFAWDSQHSALAGLSFDA